MTPWNYLIAKLLTTRPFYDSTALSMQILLKELEILQTNQSVFRYSDITCGFGDFQKNRLKMIMVVAPQYGVTKPR